jgi:hypothetical protein
MNPKTGQWEDTFSIITSDANGKMGEIHDRQPVIFDSLEPREYGSGWLRVRGCRFTCRGFWERRRWCGSLVVEGRKSGGGAAARVV